MTLMSLHKLETVAVAIFPMKTGMPSVIILKRAVPFSQPTNRYDSLKTSSYQAAMSFTFSVSIKSLGTKATSDKFNMSTSSPWANPNPESAQRPHVAKSNRGRMVDDETNMMPSDWLSSTHTALSKVTDETTNLASHRRHRPRWKGALQCSRGRRSQRQSLGTGNEPPRRHPSLSMESSDWNIPGRGLAWRRRGRPFGRGFRGSTLDNQAQTGHP